MQWPDMLDNVVGFALIAIEIKARASSRAFFVWMKPPPIWFCSDTHPRLTRSFGLVRMDLRAGLNSTEHEGKDDVRSHQNGRQTVQSCR